MLVLRIDSKLCGPPGLQFGPIAGWWFQTFFIFHSIYGIILPIDFHIFQRGWNHQPDIHRFPIGSPRNARPGALGRSFRCGTGHWSSQPQGAAVSGVRWILFFLTNKGFSMGFSMGFNFPWDLIGFNGFSMGFHEKSYEENKIIKTRLTGRSSSRSWSFLMGKSIEINGDFLAIVWFV